MEENKQTLYNDELLDILPDGVIIFNINGEVIQLNRQAQTELHVHSSANEMMPLSTNDLFKLLNNKEDILSAFTIFKYKRSNCHYIIINIYLLHNFQY